jgi:hypothetical protein
MPIPHYESLQRLQENFSDAMRKLIRKSPVLPENTLYVRDHQRFAFQLKDASGQRRVEVKRSFGG